ncbi:P1 family peptidase [Pseudonocardia sp. H11422]|uniref:P1 family peptidase n=1 Tax=Pseudonocardia sp. H11422 TaxID=2835866 RepID=UPI001BDCDE55|nr:P1 family peptidase [Pseudonocardia sp. H11422]
MHPGPHNALTDVPGLRVGHAALTGDGAFSGTTVVLAPEGGAVGGVDVRGAAPGTRETDLLDPRNSVQRIHAVVLSGGSAYGLAAADGIMRRLEDAGIGFPVGAAPGAVVPIVPAAVIFDLGRGGNIRARPDAALGAEAYDDAVAGPGAGPVAQGVVGAGTGAVAGGLKGGIGTASAVLDGGGTVAALVVVNAAGSAVDPGTGELYGARCGMEGEFPAMTPGPSALETLRSIVAARRPRQVGMATTLGVVATDLTLDKAGCARLAGMGHDGLARAISPVHTTMDGDTIFGLSTVDRPAPDAVTLYELQAAAADVVSRAVAHALLVAGTVRTSGGEWLGYRELLG